MISITNNPVVNYLREAKMELEKVAWPTKKDTVMYSGVVIALCASVAIYFGLLDWVLNKGLEVLVSMTSG